MNGGMFGLLVSKAFNASDTDHSGFIDRDELEVALNRFAKDLRLEKVTHEDVNEYLKKLDKDENGVVDEEEFRKLVQEMIAKRAVRATKKE